MVKMKVVGYVRNALDVKKILKVAVPAVVAIVFKRQVADAAGWVNKVLS